MVAFPHLPAGVSHVVDALLDAFAVEVEYKEEDEADEAQDYTQEDIRGLQSEVCRSISLVASQSHRPHGKQGRVSHAGWEGARKALDVSDAILWPVEPLSKRFNSTCARERVLSQQESSSRQGVQLLEALFWQSPEGIERQVEHLQLL